LVFMCGGGPDDGWYTTMPTGPGFKQRITNGINLLRYKNSNTLKKFNKS
jgi:hypothetical protein